MDWDEVGDVVEVSPSSEHIASTPESDPPLLMSLDLRPTTRSVHVEVAAAYALDAAGLAGPMVAVFEYGNGEIYTSFEVDVPVGRSPERMGDVHANASIPGGGVLRIYGRNDGNLITPSSPFYLKEPDEVASLPSASVFGTEAGGNIPRNVRRWTGVRSPPPSVVMRARCSYDDHPHKRVARPNTRTIWIWNGVPAQVRVLFGGKQHAAQYWVPERATSVRLRRQPLGDAFTVSLIDQFGSTKQVHIGGVEVSPVIVLPSSISQIGVRGHGAATTSCALEFEVEI